MPHVRNAARARRGLRLGAAATLGLALLAQTAGGQTTERTRYSSPIFSSVSVVSDVAFDLAQPGAAPSAVRKLDLYQPDGDTDTARPVIVWVHGGGFKPGTDRRQGYIVHMATEFAKRGYVGVAFDYRVRKRPDDDPAGTLRDAVEDGRAALAWVRRNAGAYRLDPNRIAVAGGSAGGKTAVSLVAAENREAARAGGRGVFAFLNLWGSPEEAYRPASFEASFPPTQIIHGTADTNVPFGLSEQLVSLLRTAKVDVALHPLPGAPHTPTDRMEEIVKVASQFLFRELARAR